MVIEVCVVKLVIPNLFKCASNGIMLQKVILVLHPTF